MKKVILQTTLIALFIISFTFSAFTFTLHYRNNNMQKLVNIVQYKNNIETAHSKVLYPRELVVVLHAYGSSDKHIAYMLKPMIHNISNKQYLFIPQALSVISLKPSDALLGIEKLMSERLCVKNLMQKFILKLKTRFLYYLFEIYEWFPVPFSSEKMSWESLSEQEKRIITTRCLKASVQVANLIKAKADSIKHKYRLNQDLKITIIGHSQGAMLTLGMLSQDLLENLNKIVLYGTAFNLDYIKIKKMNTKVAVHLLHGEKDTIVNIKNMKIIQDFLYDKGFHNTKSYKINIAGHKINKEVARYISSIMQINE